jgi:hypothetical protein
MSVVEEGCFMLTIAICDDRGLDRELLESLIRDYCRRELYEINMMPSVKLYL